MASARSGASASARAALSPVTAVLASAADAVAIPTTVTATTPTKRAVTRLPIERLRTVLVRRTGPSMSTLRDVQSSIGPARPTGGERANDDSNLGPSRASPITQGNSAFTL